MAQMFLLVKASRRVRLRYSPQEYADLFLDRIIEEVRNEAERLRAARCSAAIVPALLPAASDQSPGPSLGDAPGSGRGSDDRSL